jgi:uncharacterized protein (TIGR02001 family)
MPRHRQAEGKPDSLALPCCVLAAMACAPRLVQAQGGVDVTAAPAIVSEYVVRGMSLSRGRPAPQLRLDLDAGNWYAGVLASRVRYPYAEPNTQVLAYGGYARRMDSGLSWEAGALHSSFTTDGAYRYHELYAGLAGDRLAGRIYYSPSYYGDASTVYAELNGNVPLRDGLALLGHLGVLHPLGSAEDEARRRVDLRVGLSFDSGGWNLQVAVLGNLPRRHGDEAPRAVQVSVSYGF